MSIHFNKLSAYRQNQEAFLIKEKETAFTKIKFEPTINKKSQRIATQKLDSILGKQVNKLYPMS